MPTAADPALPEPGDDPVTYLITGISAAGKSTVAQLLAARLPRAVHVRGDMFRRMIVSGRAELTPALDAEALRQLWLRYELAAATADRYARAGFSVVVQDVILAEQLAAMVAMIRSRPLYVIVLAPDPAVVAARDRGRGKTGYEAWRIAELDRALREQTPRLGLWLDTSHQTPEQTVAEILDRAPFEAAVP